MLPLERQNRILEILSERKSATVEELCATLYSSGATIRRDLTVMENAGLLRRTHGGAVYMDSSSRDYPLMMRENENMMAKTLMAKEALRYIRDGQTLFMDSSSTVAHLAARLTGFKRLRVITNGLKTASILSEIGGIEVYGTGGRLRGNAKSFVGPQTVEMVRRFHADAAFFSCRGVDPITGVTDSAEEEAEVKRLYIQHAKETFLMCDGSKLGMQYFCKIVGVSEVSKIITNVQLPAEYR